MSAGLEWKSRHLDDNKRGKERKLKKPSDSACFHVQSGLAVFMSGHIFNVGTSRFWLLSTEMSCVGMLFSPSRPI